MKTRKLNLFIVDNNPLVIKSLHDYLQNRYGSRMQISTFSSGKSALGNIDTDTNIVVLDYQREGEKGSELLQSIHSINPNTEVILLSANETIGTEIDNFQKRITGPVNQKQIRWDPRKNMVYKIVTYPARIIAKEFGINKYIAMFLSTFFVMGICVVVALKFFR